MSPGNLDLTDPEDRVPLDVEASQKINVGGGEFKGMNVFPIGDIKGVNLVFHLWVRNRNYKPTSDSSKASSSAFQQRRKYGWEQGTIWRLTDDGHRSQNGTVLTATPEEAQVTHFGGELQFLRKWGDRQEFLPWPKQTTFDLKIGTPSRPARHCRYNVSAPLTEWEFPRDLHPLATFEFPAPVLGEDPVIKFAELNQRCCGDTVYCTLDVPRDIGKGDVKVTITYPAWTERDVAPTTFELPVRREISDRSEQSIVLFRQKNKSVTLKDIQKALNEFQVKSRLREVGDQAFLAIQVDSDGDIPYLVVNLEQGEEVADFAIELAGSGEQYRMLHDCDARIRIHITDFSQGEDHPKLLSTVEHALQDLTKGGVYRTWTSDFTPTP